MNRRVRPRQKDDTTPATPRPGIAERLASWRDLHLYSLFSSLGRLAQRPWASLLTIGVMAIALALPLGLLLTLGNVGRLAGDRSRSRCIRRWATSTEQQTADRVNPAATTSRVEQDGKSSQGCRSVR